MTKAAFLSSASVIGLLALAAPAMADPDMTGVAQLYVGGGTTDGSFFAGKVLDDAFLFGGKAQGYWTLSPDLHLQVDLFAQQSDNLLRNVSDNETDSTRIRRTYQTVGEHGKGQPPAHSTYSRLSRAPRHPDSRTFQDNPG